MRLVLVGPPGSGKGTQANLLRDRHGLEYIGTGVKLREAVEAGTEAGKRAAPYLANGRLVPDDLVNEFIDEYFQQDNRPRCFVMDGYPRTVAQAIHFDELLNRLGLPLQAVVRLVIPEDLVVRRMAERWVCQNAACGATYHPRHNPPKKPGVCDKCGSQLGQRLDDGEESTIRARLRAYQQETEPILQYYQQRGLLREVSANDEIENVSANIIRLIEE